MDMGIDMDIDPTPLSSAEDHNNIEEIIDILNDDDEFQEEIDKLTVSQISCSQPSYLF